MPLLSILAVLHYITIKNMFTGFSEPNSAVWHVQTSLNCMEVMHMSSGAEFGSVICLQVMLVSIAAFFVFFFLHC